MLSLVKAALLMLTIATSVIVFPTVYGQMITLSPIVETHSNNISLNVQFSNGTRATLENQSVSEPTTNAIITTINALLEAPMEELDPTLEEQLEELEEIEEEEIEEFEEDSDDNDNGGGGGDSNGGNDNGDDNGNNGNDDLLDDLLPIPEPFFPDEEGEEDNGGSEPVDEEVEEEELVLEGFVDCGQIFLPEFVPEECREKYLEAIENEKEPIVACNWSYDPETGECVSPPKT